MQNRGMLRTGHRFYFFKTYYFEEIFKKKKRMKERPNLPRKIVKYESQKTPKPHTKNLSHTDNQS